MAIKRMKTLTFKLPDFNETYSFIQEDTTLTVKGAAADAQATGNAIAAAIVSGSRAERQSGMLVTEQTNLYDKTTRSVDTGISATTGNEVSKNGWDVSDYIPVTGGSTYMAKVWNNDINAWSTAPITNSTATLYAVYDAEKTFIESGVAAAFTTDGITIPAGASYLRLMCRKNTIATAPEWIVVAEKGYFPESFIAYENYTYSTTGELANVIDSIAPVHGSTASENISAGSLLMQNGALYQATQAIVAGAEITPGTNVTGTDLATLLKPANGSVTYTTNSYVNSALATSSWVRSYPFGLAFLRLFIPVTSALPTDGTKVAVGTVSPAPSVAVYIPTICNSADGVGQIEVEITAAGVINVSTRGVSKPSSGWGSYNVLIPYIAV